MFRVFLFSILSLSLSSCAQLQRSNKTKPVLYGVAGGVALALATQDQQENKSLHIVNGAALGGLLTWAYLAATNEPEIHQTSQEIKDLKNTISFVEQVQQQDQGAKGTPLKKTSVKSWETEKLTKDGKDLIFIDSTYEKKNDK